MLDKGRGLRGGGEEKAELWSRAVKCISLAASPSSRLPHSFLTKEQILYGNPKIWLGFKVAPGTSGL